MSTIAGTTGNDTLFGTSSADLMSALEGDDTVGVVVDTIYGNLGDDTIYGGAGIDSISGGAGNDSISSGGGSDILVFASDFGQDSIVDYDDGSDRFDARNSGVSSFSALTVAQSGSDTVITFTAGNTITLIGVDKALIGSSDFTFS
ncbi:MAG: hypothetical protein EXQ92_10380 [Alphaproteobacteria bacterium]|nr:hypothetical protein [Alphaproteobacteria bacterium]